MAQEIPIEGKADSAVRVIEYEDLACGDCANYRKMLDQHLLPKFGSRVAFIHKDFPLPKHPWAAYAAVAGRFFASKDADVALAWRKYCLESRYEITVENIGEKIGAFARKHSVDEAAAVASLKDMNLQKLVNKDYQEGIARGVSKTPTVYVNGKPYIEVFSVDEISSGIEAALASTSKQ